MRINRYLAACGLGSRRACEELIAAGKVQVNGEIATLATQVEPDDAVMIQGRRMRPRQTRTILFHKPKAVLCTREREDGRRVIYDYLDPDMGDLQHVGRLDYESEGLLVMTNDGDLAQRLTHARFGSEKVYLVTLTRAFDPTLLPKLLKGFIFEEGRAKAKSAKHLGGPKVEVVLNTGINRQIRRMFARLEYEVKKLIRTRMGPFELKGISSGQWRPARPPEIDSVSKTADPPPPRRKRRTPARKPADTAKSGPKEKRARRRGR